MALNYRTSLKTTRMQDVVDAIGSGGTLEIATDSGFGTILSIHTLSSPCGTVVGDTLTFDAIQDGTGANDGTAAAARIKDGSASVVVDGLNVGTGGGNDIVLDNGIVSTGNTVTISSGSIQHA